MEPDRLLAVAGAVVDGATVSWDDEVRLAEDERAASALRALRDLERIALAHRRIEGAYDTAASTNNAPVDGNEPPPARWGHLAVLDPIGKGAFGTVYRAHDSGLGVDVALKLLSRSRTAASGSASRVLKEARLLARVRHPNVVRVYGVDETQEQAGLWMEFVKGRTLEELLRTQGPFGAHEASLIGRDLCRAMAAVHQAGVVHGDIKAHNVMREEGGRTVLMDFGAGQTLTGVAPGGPAHLTGTPAYLPPEVLEGQPPTTSTDIYTLGVLLYHLVTGEYPVAGRSPEDLVEAHRRGERRHLRDVRPDLPDEIVRVVEQATAFDPARRFVSLGALEDALALVTSPTRAEPERMLVSGRPILAAMPRWVMMLAAATVLVGGATLWLSRPNTAPEATTAVAGQSSPSSAGSPAAASYEIEAGFYRASGKDAQLLTEDSQVSPGDELFLKFQASKPLNLYIVNEDEKGESFLLFPLPGQRLTNPLPAGQPVTVPDATRWQVTSAGGREHFLVFASPDSLVAFEQVFATLPTPRESTPVRAAALPATTLERLRGVGGLAPPPAGQPAGAGLWRMFSAPLTNGRESARGLWVRQMTLENPAR